MNAAALFVDQVMELREELKSYEKALKRLRKQLDIYIDDYLDTKDLDNDDTFA